MRNAMTMSLKLNEKDKEIQCFCGDGDSKTTVITYKIMLNYKLLIINTLAKCG